MSGSRHLVSAIPVVTAFLALLRDMTSTTIAVRFGKLSEPDDCEGLAISDRSLQSLCNRHRRGPRKAERSFSDWWLHEAVGL